MSVYRGSDATDERQAWLTVLRRQRFSEEEIASELGFDGDRGKMYERLAEDGLPICRWCGSRPDEGHECERPKSREKQEREAKSGTGEWTKLPPVRDAAGPFRQALAILGRAIDSLEDREEHL